MEKRGRLLRALMEYGASDYYPFHMPGHKRNEKGLDFPNPFSVDITEIDGFDNLHHPEGILKESMERAAAVYGADRTRYLVNGSTCGLLSAICGCVGAGGKLLMSRNCHKSVYHGVFLNHLKTEYVYPQIIPGFGLQGGLLAEDVRKMLITVPDIRAVLVVSPTYDGIVSDIRGIAEAAHEHGIPLIVDEAHGAHFAFGNRWPVPALEFGADVVIQSLYKTLPSLTQTALLHWRKGYVDFEDIDRYLHIFQSSSPSYVLMAGIERCIEMMDEDGEAVMEAFWKRLYGLRDRLKGMKHLRLLGEEAKGSAGVWDMDLSKVVVSTRGTALDGGKLGGILRDRYHLEMEMCGPDYVTAITTAWDTDEGLDRLGAALLEIDGGLAEDIAGGWKDREPAPAMEYPVIEMGIREAADREQEIVRLTESCGRISGEYLYLYPPGIPILAPGEVISAGMLEQAAGYIRMGLPVQGLRDENLEWIRVVKKFD